MGPKLIRDLDYDFGPYFPSVGPYFPSLGWGGVGWGTFAEIIEKLGKLKVDEMRMMTTPLLFINNHVRTIWGP